MINFNVPSITELEHQFVAKSLAGKLCGDGQYTKEASRLFEKATGIKDMILTTSCTHALEIAALLCDFKEGDEVILPSYTFSSTANAFLLHGAKLVFCDLRTDTLNIDENLITNLITDKTKAIAPVHYAGVSCEMDVINNIADKHGLFVIEDAAQAVGSTYHGRQCGDLSDFGCYSFHETKNYSMGEGGGLIIRDPDNRVKAEIIREKGTDRSRFWRGEVDKYTWRAAGSSYLPSDVLAAMLCAQLMRFDEIMQSRLNVWNTYHNAFESLEEKGWRRPIVPDGCTHNAHMYYLIAPSPGERTRVLKELVNEKGVYAVSHYEPLHASPMGISLGYSPDDLPLTLDYAARIFRLPMWAGLSEDNLQHIIKSVFEVCVN